MKTFSAGLVQGVSLQHAVSGCAVQLLKAAVLYIVLQSSRHCHNVH